MYTKATRVAKEGVGRRWDAPVAAPSEELKANREKGRRGLATELRYLGMQYVPRIPDPLNADAPYWVAL